MAIIGSLNSGMALTPIGDGGENTVYSTNLKYGLTLQSNGNLVLVRREDEVIIWESYTNGKDVAMAISECGEPEAVNNSRQTAPSKRLDAWSARKKFPKTTTGITVAKEIGITKMREKCPQFNIWIAQFESIIAELNEA